MDALPRELHPRAPRAVVLAVDVGGTEASTVAVAVIGPPLLE